MTRWMIIGDAFGADRLIEFLGALVQDTKRKILLVLYNFRGHHSKLAKACVAERVDQIELFYLPSNSPELNPEECLNADLKQHIGSKLPARTKARMKAVAAEHMERLEQLSDCVRSYFQDPRVKHAA